MIRDLGLTPLVVLLLALTGCAGPEARVPPPAAPVAPAPRPEPATMGEYLREIEAAYRRSDFDRGLALVKRMLELQQTTVSTYDRLGSVYYVLGRSGEALTFWNRALTLEKDPGRRRRLATSITLARRNLGLPEETSPPSASPAPRRPPRPAPVAAPRVSPQESARHYKEGVRYYAEGEYLQATASFMRALELDPGNEEARKALERLRLQSGGKTAP